MLLPRNRTRLLAEIGIKDKICIEVGVRLGRNAQRIINSKPKHLYLVDYWGTIENYCDKRKTDNATYELMYQQVKEKFAQYPNVTIIRDLSVNAAKNFADESADYIYLDANHSEESTYKDLIAWSRVLKMGCWMCGHDYFTPPSWSGVHNAVTRYLADTKQELGLVTRNEKFPSFGFIKTTSYTPPMPD